LVSRRVKKSSIKGALKGIKRVEKWGLEVLSVAMLGIGERPVPKLWMGGFNVKRNGDNEVR
jgi:hypothetical protein